MTMIPLVFRIGSKITWHSVGKMSSLFGTFENRLCQVIFERALRRDTEKPPVAIHNRADGTQTRDQPLFLKYLGILILLLLVNQPTANAWNLELGAHQLMPRLWTGEQKYENATGGQLKFKPAIQKTISGQSVSLGLVYENLTFQLEQVAYQYISDIPTQYATFTTETTTKVDVKEQRVGVNYHLERELAGIFVGIGLTREEEKIAAGGDAWFYETDVPYGKLGIDLILGAWRIRIEQIHFVFGKHSAKVSSIGILLYL
jgi:hypothetical protein